MMLGEVHNVNMPGESTMYYDHATRHNSLWGPASGVTKIGSGKQLSRRHSHIFA